MKLLICFQKAEVVRHLGHLDLQRAMQRALRRSGLPVRYSQGFHPHMLTSFASALSMGVSSRGEVVEVSLSAPVTQEEALARLSAVLPEALAPLAVALAEDTHPAPMGLLKQATYEVLLPGTPPQTLAPAVSALLAQAQVMAMRKTKSGEKLTDIRPMLHALTLEEAPEGARLCMRVSLEETATLKPELVLSVLAAQSGLSLPAPRIVRTGLWGLTDGQPVPLMTL